MTMRRLSLMFVVLAVLAGCSSGATKTASSTQSSTPTGASSTSPKGTSSTSPKAKSSPSAAKSPKASATPHKVIIGGAKNFCGAFVELRSVKASDGAATASAVYLAAAADMRKFAPPAIKSAAHSYADVTEAAGKALKTNTLPAASPVKSATLATVTVWVSKNCPKK